MVTSIHKHVKPRLYLRENRRAKGLSATQVAGRMDMERESVLRLERETWRCSPDKQAQYAAAIGVDPRDLWNPPSAGPSIDAIVQNEPDEVRHMAVDIVRRLVAGRR